MVTSLSIVVRCAPKMCNIVQARSGQTRQENTLNTRKRPLSLVSLLIFIAVLIGLSVGAEQASAHNLSISAACNQGTPAGHVDFENYSSANTIQVWVDGSSVLSSSFDSSFVHTYDLGNPTVSHTFRVRVVASDDPTFTKGYSVDVTKNVPACQDPTTTTAAATTTTAVTTTTGVTTTVGETTTLPGTTVPSLPPTGGSPGSTEAVAVVLIVLGLAALLLVRRRTA